MPAALSNALAWWLAASRRADVVERFQLVTFLCLIGLRNWAELGNAVTTHAYLFGTLLPQMTVFAVSEVSIDWLKVRTARHAAGGAAHG